MKTAPHEIPDTPPSRKELAQQMAREDGRKAASAYRIAPERAQERAEKRSMLAIVNIGKPTEAKRDPMLELAQKILAQRADKTQQPEPHAESKLDPQLAEAVRQAKEAAQLQRDIAQAKKIAAQQRAQQKELEAEKQRAAMDVISADRERRVSCQTCQTFRRNSGICSNTPKPCRRMRRSNRRSPRSFLQACRNAFGSLKH